MPGSHSNTKRILNRWRVTDYESQSSSRDSPERVKRCTRNGSVNMDSTEQHEDFGRVKNWSTSSRRENSQNSVKSNNNKRFDLLRMEETDRVRLSRKNDTRYGENRSDNDSWNARGFSFTGKMCIDSIDANNHGNRIPYSTPDSMIKRHLDRDLVDQHRAREHEPRKRKWLHDMFDKDDTQNSNDRNDRGSKILGRPLVDCRRGGWTSRSGGVYIPADSVDEEDDPLLSHEIIHRNGNVDRRSLSEDKDRGREVDRGGESPKYELD